jgi:3-deoxy-D-manno-octulosonic-acid transferase
MVSHFTPTKLRRGTLLKWAVFQLLERLSDLRGNKAAGHLEISPTTKPRRSIWVFASTIGEINAIDPLLREIVAATSQLQLVLITDHPHYRDSYLARYPHAQLCVTRGHSSDARKLAISYPPEMLVVAEIPCLPSDAPCRFSFAFLMEAKRHGARTVLVNGWLYHYAPPSRMDRIERQLFGKDYVRAFDALCVQTEKTRHHLLVAGAESHRVAVTGNVKFDAVDRTDWSTLKARSPQMLGALVNSTRKIIVAGCVTDFAEQECVLDAFASVRERHPDALLVLAPRHPEVSERMRILRQSLNQRGLDAVFRSELPDTPLADTTACLVLDTMGELRDFYAAANMAHVGVDHNVLEPLAFGKPVTVLSGWNTTYPSYPVYQLLVDSQTLIEIAAPEQLSIAWLNLIDSPTEYRDRVSNIDATLTRARGAVARHMSILRPSIPFDAYRPPATPDES